MLILHFLLLIIAVKISWSNSNVFQNAAFKDVEETLNQSELHVDEKLDKGDALEKSIRSNHNRFNSIKSRSNISKTLFDIDLEPGPFDEPSAEEYSHVLAALRTHIRDLYAQDIVQYVNQAMSSINNRSFSNKFEEFQSNSQRPTWEKLLHLDSLWGMNLLIPNKSIRSEYFSEQQHKFGSLKHKRSSLPRYVHAIIFRASLETPEVQEYHVGPFNENIKVVLAARQPFFKRPIDDIEFGALVDFLSVICLKLDPIIQKAYNASFFRSSPTNLWTGSLLGMSEFELNQAKRSSKCQSMPTDTLHERGEPNCLIPMFASAVVTREAPGRRQFWFRLVHNVLPLIQHPVDLQIQIDHTSITPQDWYVKQIWFQHQLYSSVDELLLAHQSNKLNITLRPFIDVYPDSVLSRYGHTSTPESFYTTESTNEKRSEGDSTKASCLKNFDGYLNESQRPNPTVPLSIQHKTISINRRRVRYKNWDFHLTVRRDTGVRLYGVYFAGVSLVAEAGLDETVTAYWGISPFMRKMTSIESMFGVGRMTSELSPGIDCPSKAIYLPVQIIPSGSVGPKTIKRGICLFEWSAHVPGGPIRRHYEFLPENSKFSQMGHTNFGFGAPNRALVVRFVSSLFNYDYLFDIILYVSGVIEFAVTPTGFVHVDILNASLNVPLNHTPQFPWIRPDAFGFLSPRFPITFVAHHHLFNYKVDLDVLSRKNFLQVIKIHGPLSDTPDKNMDPNQPALWMSSHIPQSEMETKFSTRFESPRQYLICNYDKDHDQKKHQTSNKSHMNSHCLILINKSPIKTLFNDNHTKAFAWSRHQLIVTRQRDNETYSSSVFNGVDLNDPVVDFLKFSSNNESIYNEDLVMWLTMGNYHLPRQEDLPNTATSGGRLSFYIMPHNLFHYSPDAYSCDGFYTNDINRWRQGVNANSNECKTEPIPTI